MYHTRAIKSRRQYSKNMFLTLRLLSHKTDIKNYFMLKPKGAVTYREWPLKARVW